MRRRFTLLLRAVVIGVATLFAAKTEREQHWSTPPTMVIERKDVIEDNGDGRRLPRCA